MNNCIAGKQFFFKILAALLVILLQIVILPLKTKGQSSSQLKGNTNKVLTIPNGTVDAGLVNFKSDKDNDGMPDDDELQNGTDPDDPSDADGDLDGDGVSNGDEVARGTNPNSADSDGDGVSDAEEIRLGYDPLDANNTPPPNTAIISLQVSPNPRSLSVNTIFGSTPVQLTVNGLTNTGTTVNLTNDTNTVYQSLDQAVAAVTTSGSVFGIAEGATVVRVQNGNLSADATVNVGSFSPVGTSALSIPGYANNVDVVGNFAYVAAGISGLQIVDISDRSNPFIAASYNTTGNANDVRVINGLAYVADGVSGLQIINVSDPLNPILTGSYNTPGEANDVVIRQNTVYIADGLSGLRILDVTNPATPQVIGTIDTPGKTRGVDVSGNYAVLAEGSPSRAVRIVDISNPATPQLAGTLTQTDEVIDLVVQDDNAFVAGWLGGLKTVSFANPASPTLIASYSADFNGFSPRDVTLNGDFLMAAETIQNNFVPFFNVSDPTVLNYRGGVNQANLGFAQNTGIASDDQFVYTTGVSFISSADKGVNGNSNLFIGRYKIPESDNNGIAPTVNLTSPSTGETVRQGKQIYFAAEASDDVFVAGVQFKIDNVVVATVSGSPYEFIYDVPLNAASFSVTATAFDLGGNISTTQPVAVTVEPDTLPVVNIAEPVQDTVLVEGENINILIDASDDEGVNYIIVKVNGEEFTYLYYSPYETELTVPSGINSLTLEVEATDTVGNTAVATRSFNVIPDPDTTVSGRVVTADGQPAANATVSVFEEMTAQTAADGTYSITNVPTIRGDITVKASALINNINAANASIPLAPVRGGNTNSGDIILSTGSTAPTAIAAGYFGERGYDFYGQDLFVTYNDRLSAVYSFNGTEFVPRTVGQMEVGSTTAGNSTSLFDFYYSNQTFIQLSGQPGSINKFQPNFGDQILRSNLQTGLTGESEYVGVGRDSSTGNQVTAFLSNDPSNGATVKLKTGNNDPVTVPIPDGLILHSLVLSDVDNNGYADVIAVQQMPDGTAKLITVSRSSSEPPPQQLVESVEFAPPIESDIIERTANPSNGLNNIFVGDFSETYGKEIAVLGDDRVRIYGADASGIYIFEQEIILPVGEIPTGAFVYSLTNSGYSDLLITTKNSADPDSRSLLVYFNSLTGGGCPGCNTDLSRSKDKTSKTGSSERLFDAPLTRSYTVSNSNGDTRIIVGDWEGGGSQNNLNNQLDVVIFDGDRILHFQDIGPYNPPNS